jgi:hypothetical protein
MLESLSIVESCNPDVDPHQIRRASSGYDLKVGPEPAVSDVEVFQNAIKKESEFPEKMRIYCHGRKMTHVYIHSYHVWHRYCFLHQLDQRPINVYSANQVESRRQQLNPDSLDSLVFLPLLSYETKLYILIFM